MDVSVGGPQFIQYRFSQPKPGILTLGDRPVTNLNGQGVGSNASGSYAVKTGSCVVHQKSSFGRTTWAQAASISPDSGYANWGQGIWGGNSGAVYVILHREDVPEGQSESEVPKWCLSLVNESDLVPEDIRVAVIVSTKCVQLWQSDIYYTQGAGGVAQDHPFKVIHVGSDEEEETSTYKIVHGTVTNQIPGNIAEEITVSTDEYDVWLKVPYDMSATPSFPAATGFEWEIGTPLPDDTASEGYVRLAKVNGPTVTQYVTGSLWADRIQVGAGATLKAYYYYARI